MAVVSRLCDARVVCLGFLSGALLFLRLLSFFSPGCLPSSRLSAVAGAMFDFIDQLLNVVECVKNGANYQASGVPP